MNYLIVPADLETNELAVYAWLYKHSNQTKDNYKGLKKHEVYFSNRLIAEHTELDKMKINRALKKLEEKEYIKIISKSKSKNKSSKCLLTFNNSLNSDTVHDTVHDTVSDTVHDTVSDTVQSIDTTCIEGNSKTVHDTVHDTVNDTVSDTISNNISNNRINKYNHIYNTWLEEDIVKHKSLTNVMKKNIDKVLKKYKIDDIVLAIKRYGEMYKSNYPYCNYRWTMNEFLTREKGFAYFLDEGDKWINYTEWKENNNTDIMLDEETKRKLEQRKKAMKGL